MKLVNGVEVRAFCYESEDPKKVEEMLKILDNNIKLTKVEGFYKDVIRIYEIKGKGDALVNKISNLMEEDTKIYIRDNIFELLDENLRLHLKFDKQYFYQKGKLKYYDGDDTIKVIIIFKKPSPKQNLNKYIEGIIEYLRDKKVIA
jgi:RNA binding exosome subunit